MTTERAHRLIRMTSDAANMLPDDASVRLQMMDESPPRTIA
jgi:hypothetical protein